MKTQHVLIGIVVSALLHTGVAMMLLHHNKSTGSLAAGEGGLMVSVGIAGRFSELAKGSDEATDSEVPELVEQAEQTQSEPEPEPQPEPIPEQAPEPKSEPKVKSEPKPKPKKQPKPKPESEPKPEPKPAKTEATRKTDSQSRTRAMVTHATGTGERVETGGNVAARADYFAAVKAHIARKKRYPRSARRDGATGTVTVRFVIQPNGKVQQAEVVKGSGDPRLDKEALAMLQRASPLPAIPAELDDAALPLALPIEFSLKAKRWLF